MAAALSVRARLIGAALRQHREGAGLDLLDAASVLGCDRSKVCRIEAGERGILPGELGRLLGAYGAGPDEAQALEALAQAGLARGWWDSYRQVLGPGYLDVMATEHAAAGVAVYAPLQVPELLHCKEHAVAAAEAGPDAPPALAARAAAATMARQDAILRQRGIPVDVVLGEAALWSAPGGAAVRRAQARHLLALTAACPPRVTIWLLPLGDGTQAAGGSGGFSLLRFSKVPVPGMALIDGPAGFLYVDAPDSVAAYGRAFEALVCLALDPGETARRLSQACQHDLAGSAPPVTTAILPR